MKIIIRNILLTLLLLASVVYGLINESIPTGFTYDGHLYANDFTQPGALKWFNYDMAKNFRVLVIGIYGLCIAFGKNTDYLKGLMIAQVLIGVWEAYDLIKYADQGGITSLFAEFTIITSAIAAWIIYRTFKLWKYERGKRGIGDHTKTYT